jgi:uncharacterized protein YbcI
MDEARQTIDRSELAASELKDISNAMVRLYKQQFGRGPTKARTNMAGPDIVVSTLEDSLTPAERNMAKAGEHQRLRDVRLYFQEATREEFVGAVEGITGRKVRAFVSGLDTSRDVATEVFYLEPLAAVDGRSPATAGDAG